MKKRFAVFIPAYNASKTVIETLNGINRAAAVIRQIVPVYVVDDCSKDDTAEVIENHKFSNLDIHLDINKVNLGERGTINAYFKKLDNEIDWIFLIHADDIPKCNWLQDIIEVIEKADDNKYFTVWSSYDSFNNHTGEETEGDNDGEIVFNNRNTIDARTYIAKVTCSWHVSGAAINRKLFEKIGGFDAAMPQYGDTDFFAAGMLSGYNDIYLRKTLTRYRIITSSVSFISKNTNRDIREMMYLINKYNIVLTAHEKMKISLLAVKNCSRRIIKHAIKGRIYTVYNLVPLTFKAFVSFLFYRGKTILNVREK
jgi:glycosyltransferase involved in cell wall biosynthesis